MIPTMLIESGFPRVTRIWEHYSRSFAKFAVHPLSTGPQLPAHSSSHVDSLSI